MNVFSLIVLVFRGVCVATGLSDAAVSAQDLRIHRAAIRTGQEGNNARYVGRLSQAFQWCHVGDLCDLLFGLTFQEEFGCNRPGATALTVILRPRSSFASTWTKPSTPALDAMYGP
jgi:hypothetical protein